MFKRLINCFRKNKEVLEDVDPMIQIEKDIAYYIDHGYDYAEVAFGVVASKFVHAIREDMRWCPYDENGVSTCETININGGLIGANGRLIHDFGLTYSLDEKRDKHGHTSTLYARSLMTLTLLRGRSEKYIKNVLKNFVVKTDMYTYYYDTKTGDIKKKEEEQK